MKNLIKTVAITLVLFSGLVMLVSSQATTAKEIETIYVSLHKGMN